ncbi:MAG: hypothetical protein PF961_16115 [Planctomycetota bacterium]|nr:hypothetical protein [Planctomycetota bacterium]
MKFIFAVALAVLVQISCAGAAKLTAEVESLAQGLRDQAPLPVEISLTWTGTEVVTGQMIALIHEQQRNRRRVVLDDVVVQPGTRRFSLLLPPVQLDEVMTQLELDLTLELPDGRRELGSWVVGTKLGKLMQLSVAELSAGFGAGDTRLAAGANPLVVFADALPLEAEDQLSMRITALANTRAPRQALAWLAWDMVVVRAGADQGLDKAQLKALLAWTGAGGLLLVEDLARSGPALQAATKEADALGDGCFIYGRGRIAQCQVGGADMGPSARFLWGDDMVGAVSATMMGRDYYEYGDNGDAQQLTDALMPDTIRLVPIWALVLTLVVFVIAIGPLEWLVLGAIGKRVLTWVTFPLTALVCTGFTLALSQHYLGNDDHRAAVTVVDIGLNGRVVRQERIELQFAAHNTEVEVSMAGALVGLVDADRNPIDSGVWYGQPGQTGQYRFTLPKWTPRLVRSLRFDDRDLEGLDLDWSAVLAEPRHNMRAALQQRYGSEAAVFHASAGNERHGGNAAAIPEWLRTSLSMGSHDRGRAIGRAPRAGNSLLDVFPTVAPGDDRLVVMLPGDDGELLVLRRDFRRQP